MAVSLRRYTATAAPRAAELPVATPPHVGRKAARSASAHACCTRNRKTWGFQWKHADLDESPPTQRVPIVHGLSRACRAPVKPRRSAPASEQPGAHCWLRPRPRPRRSRVCQNTSLEPHRRLARGSAYRLHGSAPRFPKSKRRFFKISTARKGSAPALFVTSLQAWSLQLLREQKTGSLRALAGSPQPPLRKRLPRTQLRCFDTNVAIFNMSKDATGQTFFSVASGYQFFVQSLLGRPNCITNT